MRWALYAVETRRATPPAVVVEYLIATFDNLSDALHEASIRLAPVVIREIVP